MFQNMSIQEESEIKDNLSGGLLKKKRLAEKIKTFIINHVNKFNF